MKIDTNLFSMQLDVPHSKYGNGDYFIYEPMCEWLRNHDIRSWSYCGGGSWGNGYTNGITNQESVYMVYNIREDDATAFQIQFPHCKVHLSKQYDYA